MSKEKQNYYLLVTGLAIAAFLASFNITNINIALPALMQYYGCDMATVQWIVVGYMLASGVVMPLIGYLMNHYSGKNVITTSLLALGISSLLCMIAPNIVILITARLVQGAAGGLLMAVPMASVYQLIEPEKQMTSIAAVSMIISVGTALGPTLAGVLIDLWGWQAIFFASVPVVIVDLLLVAKYVPCKRFSDDEKLDGIGVLLAILSTIALLFGFNQGGTFGWTSPLTILLLAGGVILLGAFILRELKIKEPLLDFSVFRFSSFSLSFILNAVFNVAICMTPMFMSLFLQNVTGVNATTAGLAMLIPALSMVVMAPLAAKNSKYMSSRGIILLGTVVVCVATWEVGRFDLQTTLVGFTIWMTLRYAGIGYTTPIISNYALGGIPQHLASHASSMLNWTRQLLTTIAVSIFSVFYSSRMLVLGSELPNMQLAECQAISEVVFISLIIMIMTIPVIVMMTEAKKQIHPQNKLKQK